MKHLLTGLFIFFCSFAFSQGAWDRWVTTSGTNTYTATVTVPTFPSSYNNTVLRLKFPNSNTGASTINVNSTGAIPIRKWDGDSWEPLVSGDIPANSSALLYYDNTNAYYSAIIFESIGGSGSTPTLQEVLTAGSVLTVEDSISMAYDFVDEKILRINLYDAALPSNKVELNFDSQFGGLTGSWTGYSTAAVNAGLNITSAGKATFFAVNGSEFINFVLDGSAKTATIEDNRTVKLGWQYAADYSADFTARSIVDKAYVDAVAGGGAVSSVFTRTGAVVAASGDYTVSQVTGAAPLASPTFTGTVTIPTPFTLGATSVTSTGTQLNYLNAATGTTGTASTNLVFSTSPTLITPALGTPSAVVLTNATGLPVTGIAPGSGSAFDEIRINSGNTAYERFTPTFNPMTTVGDIIVGLTSGVPDELAIGTTNQVLTVISGTPAWRTPTTSIIGTVTNDAAAAGNIGEEIVAIQSTYTNFTTTATYQNITSITLTAGDWDISAFFTYSSNSATITAASNSIFVISTTTASAAGAVEGRNIAYLPQAGLLGTSLFSDSISPYRVSISGSTTYYLNAQATFTAGNPQYVGGLRARRIR
jgi:hypothetical protein